MHPYVCTAHTCVQCARKKRNNMKPINRKWSDWVTFVLMMRPYVCAQNNCSWKEATLINIQAHRVHCLLIKKNTEIKQKRSQLNKKYSLWKHLFPVLFLGENVSRIYECCSIYLTFICHLPPFCLCMWFLLVHRGRQNLRINAVCYCLSFPASLFIFCSWNMSLQACLKWHG